MADMMEAVSLEEELIRKKLAKSPVADQLLADEEAAPGMEGEFAFQEGAENLQGSRGAGQGTQRSIKARSAFTGYSKAQLKQQKNQREYEWLGLEPGMGAIGTSMGLSSKDMFGSLGSIGMKGFNDVKLAIRDENIGKWGQGKYGLGGSAGNKYFARSLKEMGASDHELADKAKFLSKIFDKDKFHYQRGQRGAGSESSQQNMDVFATLNQLGPDAAGQLMQEDAFYDPRVQKGLAGMSSKLNTLTNPKMAARETRDRADYIDQVGGMYGQTSTDAMRQQADRLDAPNYLANQKDPFRGFFNKEGEFDVNEFRQFAKDKGREPDWFGSPGARVGGHLAIKTAALAALAVATGGAAAGAMGLLGAAGGGILGAGATSGAMISAIGSASMGAGAVMGGVGGAVAGAVGAFHSGQRGMSLLKSAGISGLLGAAGGALGAGLGGQSSQVSQVPTGADVGMLSNVANYQAAQGIASGVGGGGVGLMGRVKEFGANPYVKAGVKGGAKAYGIQQQVSGQMGAYRSAIDAAPGGLNQAVGDPYAIQQQELGGAQSDLIGRRRQALAGGGLNALAGRQEGLV
jgi:hypothetical protein